MAVLDRDVTGTCRQHPSIALLRWSLMATSCTMRVECDHTDDLWLLGKWAHPAGRNPIHYHELNFPAPYLQGEIKDTQFDAFSDGTWELLYIGKVEAVI